MTNFKYDWQLKYRRLITEKPYMMFFLGLIFTIIFGMGLKGLSQNPDNRILLKVEYSKGTKEKSKEDQNIIKILMGDEVAPRKDFITEKALEVENLDI